jgi:site-specific recombinase XerD
MVTDPIGDIGAVIALEDRIAKKKSGRVIPLHPDTFVTRAARLVHKTGGSLRDVQILAGHRSIQTTQGYIDGDTDAQRRLVALI